MNSESDAPRLNFDRRLKLAFHGSSVTSDAGLLPFRELEDVLGLMVIAGQYLADGRTGRSARHDLIGMLRQSVFGRLAGYEDVNDADRLGRDPAMRWIVGGRAATKQAASTSQMGRFETEWLTNDENLVALADSRRHRREFSRFSGLPALAATYIHNLTAILADKMPLAAPGSLNYSIADQPATVHDLLIQKSTGTFELVVWDEKATGNDNVVVNLGHNYDMVHIYDVTVGISPMQTLTDVGPVSLNLSDHALIIEIGTERR